MNKEINKFETSLVLMGDAVIDLMTIMATMTLITGFIQNGFAIPLIILTLTAMALYKFALVKRSGRHPCLSMINKKLPNNHRCAFNFLWPSLITVAALTLFSIYSMITANSEAVVVKDFMDMIHKTMFSVSIDKIFSIRLAIVALIHFNVIKINLVTENV